ncbi:MAG TPA: OmpA family protein [Rhizomicrobium sp.]|jgi:outer membrane protein OmpA-like peptidoglycan-associated protein|nr:OmpA family protein [Rhizomicrobium sp.]
MYRAIFAVAACSFLAACAHDQGPPAYVNQETATPAYTVSEVGGKTEYAIPDQLLFATDSSEVLPAGHAIIAELAQLAQRRGDAPIEVNGYTDTTGTKRHNQDLSVARADAVASELTKNGVAASRIKAQGFGETELAVPTADNVSEAKNRRVVVAIANANR